MSQAYFLTSFFFFPEDIEFKLHYISRILSSHKKSINHIFCLFFFTFLLIIIYTTITLFQVIHPGQVPVVQTAFSPQPEKVEWAAGLVQAFEEHQKEGKVIELVFVTA